MVIDPTHLFLRLSSTLKKPSDMETHLKYEFSNQAPALFDNGTLRKSVKSSLAAVLKSPVKPIADGVLDSPIYILDGGYLLHSYTWPTDSTYGDIAANYVRLVIRYYGRESTVCLDGYNDAM